MTNSHTLHDATKGARVGIIVYTTLASLKLVIAYFASSASLHADGLNNFTDIISSIVIFIGLNIAKQPADSNHHYGHTKFESIASFVTSLIMFTIGFEVLKSGIERFVSNNFPRPSLMGVWASIASALLLYLTQRYVAKLAHRAKSIGLKASAKDMFNDMLISIGTAVSITGATFGLPQIDTLMSLIVGILIIKTAYNIFRESTFTLSDGFDEELLNQYREAVIKHPSVQRITNLKGRLYGSQVYVDITVEIDGNLTVIESHHITEEIERILAYNYNVRDVDVHVEPFFGKIERKNDSCHQL